MSHDDSDRSDDGPFQVLSLDGGGIKGTFTAGFLAGIEEGTGKRIVDHFDLISGTSTGGIIALGLGLGLSGREILDFYRNEGHRIFRSVPGPRALSGLRQLWVPRHPTQPLQQALEGAFAARTLGESTTRLVIVSYDGVGGDIHLLKTAHHPRFRRDYKRTAVEVALATSAAPVFFQTSQQDGRCEIDGGVWANCPALVGAVEALRVVVPRPRRVSILSVGTTSEPFHVRHQWRNAGLGRWNKGVVDLLMQAQVKGALAQAALLVGKENFMRVDRVVKPRRFRMDDPSEIPDLVDLGRGAARNAEPEVLARFLSRPAPPFRPFHPERANS